jgi:hypothetical protein
LAEKVNSVVDNVQDGIQNAASQIAGGVQNIAQNIGEKVQDGLQDMGLVKEDEPEASVIPDAFEQTKQFVAVQTETGTIANDGGAGESTGRSMVGSNKIVGGNLGSGVSSMTTNTSATEANKFYSSAEGENNGAQNIVTNIGSADSGNDANNPGDGGFGGGGSNPDPNQ